MIMIIEAIFFIIGIILVISGKYPKGIYGLLIGVDNIQLPKKIVRIFGLIILSPIPVVLMITIILTLLFGNRYKTFSQVFEVAYLFIITIIIILIIVTLRRIYKIKKNENRIIDEKEIERYILIEFAKPLLLFGLTITSLFTLLNILNLPFIVNLLFHTEVAKSVINWEYIYPYIISILFIIIGIGATIILVRVYKKIEKVNS